MVPRTEYLEGIASVFLKFKPDKWHKMVSVEENMGLLTEFFEKPDVLVLVLALSPAGTISPCLGFPASLKSKGLYFIKKRPDSISKDNYKDRLVYGDIGPAPVDQLIAVVEEVLDSLLNQSENLSGWPRVVSEDLVKQVHKLKNEMFVMGGKIKGKTLLPVPEHLGSLDGTLESMERIPSSLDNSLLHAIETIVIDWSHQIRDVLSKDSAQALLDGLHPLPRVEFEFWDARLINLKCIHEQLNRPKVNKIVEILEKAKSCYWPALQNVYTNVTEGLKEAHDIVLYLKPLQILLEETEQADFTMLPTFIAKVLDTVCFIWATSEHYNTPSRVIVILQEFCNQLIETTRTFLSPEEVLKGLQGEIEEVLSGISLSVSVLKELYRAYDFCCANMKLFFKDKEPVPWEFPSSLAFSRINSFFHRVQTIENLYKTAIEFLKLEKIELGGVRGSILGSQVTQIYEEVFELVKVFADCKYDPLDPGDSSFDDDYADFETKIQDLDRRLATIFCQGFDDCSSIESCARLLHMCGGLLERPLILAEVVPRYSVMLELFDAELDNTKALYDAQMALKWSLELQERLEAPMRDLKHIEHPVMSSEEAKLIYQKYDEMMELLRNYRERIYQQWVAGVDQDCHFNLGLIHVNFSKALVAVLREVKYLNFQQQKEVPSSAETLFSQHETFRKFVGNLELIVGWYNEIKTTMMDVEFPLIKSELEAIDVQLLDAERTLFWNSEGVFDYIQEMREILHNLQNRIQKACRQGVGPEASSPNASLPLLLSFQDWSANPMFERKDNKKEALLDLDGRTAHLNKRYTAVKDAGLKIQAMVAENAELFRADVTSPSWKDYINYVDSLVLDGFYCFIRKSLNYLMDNMVADESIAPLFEVRMELDDDGLVFSPSLDMGGDRSFLALIGSLVTDIFNVARLIPRLAKGRMNYKTDLEDMTDLTELREEMSNLVLGAVKEAEEYQDSFERYSYLWADDPQEVMKNFLTFGRAVSPEDLDTRAEETLPKRPPTLAQFQQQIDAYEKLYEEVSRRENAKVFGGWLQCDCRPFKQAVLNSIKRWSLMFKRHLSNHVINSLADLEAFMKVARAGLTKPLKEGDYDGLVEVMRHLMKVKERQSATDSMFEPLKQTIELLKSYGEEMPEETHLKLQELPEQWTHTKKLAIQVKQNVAPLQANEVSILRRKCQQFELKQHEFREKFRQEAPFSFSDPEPYRSIAAMEGVMEALCKSGSLFEVTVPDYKQLKACHKEVRLLKELWDMIVMVNTSFAAWKTTKWQDINVEQMDIDCKKFAKDVRSLDKEMKSWDAFVGLDNTVKNMITALRAVSELQNPAIRDRHWQQLMQATQVKFEMSDETTLADLLQLNLHRYEDEVRNIVDKAVKESGMEKVLKALDSTWSTMEFEHEPHPRTGTMMLKADEVLVETLEDNQVQLQNLMMSKYLSHFLKEVTSWQQKLSTADSVISIWFEVQRTWSHLESIFIGSEDIRAQLPEDSTRFDDIDQEFKALMEEAVKTPNVVEATNKPGLYDKLENLKKRLAVCEKALAEYLETKRLAFPRFYFVSSADLLDILSNGNDPVEVSRHLSKLFDSLCKLKFRLDADGKPLKVSLGMYSKEDEYVDFDRDCDLSGQVEVWLNRVLDRMCATLRHEIPEAVVTYEEKPREQWIFDYPAQIWWTTEVGLAFARLEEGYENAIKDYNKKQVSQLNALITLLIGNLSAGDRMKIMTICTIDVHARDVVAKMIAVESSQAFTWQSQLRHRWDEEKQHCFANICDAQIQYSYEYLGNTPRLVITPLTDRCYITLTQSLHLIMGGAPAGPAGTGKTETTKDLGRALGTMVYVFNCSEQMDYKSCGNIYKGLAQTGAWGCFDEFNRISVEVLSVIAVQVKCVQDAIRAKKQLFNFLGEMISLIPTVGLFITMNPGTPDTSPAILPRPCAMVVPDFELICEIMLVAEGFLEARLLARKFITLYTLCKELLSKQDHYDWGLRAIKSVLVVAGSLKRGDPGRAEDQVLMRALRDFNIPKIVTDDLPVFMGLIGDLFPALDVPRKRDLNFEKVIRQSTLELRLQAEDSFVLKVVQLEELLQVRHSVFVIGNAGSGKSQVLKSLNKTYQNLKRKPVAVDLDPKAVTCDELFGIINPATREWKDGLFSTIMRDLANITHDGPKWIVLDGDIDPMWIESLNTVMDDNKVLTLASNERIPLNRTMRLVFEISHLRTATPATVSRAGILYINPADLGWNPVVSSWIERRQVQSEKANLTILFDKYLPTCLDKLRLGFKKITPVPEITVVQTVLYLLECLLTEKNAPPDSAKELYELYFVFACLWAFGGAMFQDQLVDYRVEFSKWWVNEFKTIKFPSQGTVFDYYIDPDTKKFLPWTDRVPSFELDPDVPLQASLVHTTETVRIRYFLDLLMEKSRPVMLVGNAGTGKSVLMGDKLDSLSTDEYLVQAVPFNFYTTSAMLQGVLEKPLEKKSGRNYGPPGTKKLVYFLDDMNMPEVDKYGTVAPHTLIRQHMDHGHWYDRQKLTLRDVHNCQYVACMNPTSGSFTIDPRLQRHFCVFAVSFPGQEALVTIYSSILAQHLALRSASMAVQRMSSQLVASALALHQKVTATFLPTAIKFHYVFNLRDLSNIFQGLLFSTTEILKIPLDLVRLWLHRSRASAEQDPGEVLDSYNEVNAVMNLVLFEDAVAHICRINRILDPRAATPCWWGGRQRKQSLSRLAAYISALDVFQITLKKGYGIPDLKLDLSAQYVKAAVKNAPAVFLSLVLINDLLASGEIRAVRDDEAENIVSSMRPQVKSLGLADTREACWKFFIDKVRSDLCAFSPVGLRPACAAGIFPAWSDCTAIDWFHEWPRTPWWSVQPRFALRTERDQVVRAAEAGKEGGINSTCHGDIPPPPPSPKKSHMCLLSLPRPYQGNPTFDPEFIRSKSTAAAGLCSWCINIVRFYEVYCDVAPKRQALEEANAELAEAQEKLSRIKNKIAELNANLSNLTSAFEKATAEKIRCQQEADATNRVISLANRLVGGLASENVRWAESVKNFRSQGVTLCGDVLLISAFVSYVGYFTKKYRNELMERFWIPYINRLKVPIPTTEGLDPLSLLTDDADVATWNNQGLPSDRMSTENATILCNTERWPLIVDAQLQGVKWIKNKYGHELKAIRLGQKSYLDIIEQAISEGDTLLIENIGETVDPVLDPLLGRNTIKKGKFIKIGDKEIEYHPSFRLILHTKCFNPHYKPETQAQCTLINFLVTRDGLEDQLLAAVVAKERPDLEQLKANLTKSQNEFKIVLKELEDSLLARLSAASGNFLGDTTLVENLETTKHTASEIEEKVQEAKVTEAKINEARENYRPAAERASLLYFILSDLNKINPIYQFSLKAFNVVFEKAIQKASPADEVKQRVINLTDEITYSVYVYTARGLFERDKLIFLAQVAFQVLSMKKELNPVELDFLLRFPFKAGVVSPVDFLQRQGWGGIKALSEMDEFKNLDSDIEGSAKRWKKLVESEAPEKEVFPKEWKNKTALQKLCMVRCMRPDRMTYAVKNFVEEKMGSKFVEGRSVEFAKSYEESSPSTPVFFILSPGVDPLKDVEALGKKLGFTIDNGKLHNVSLGQGQEVVAENALDEAAAKGHWVILQVWGWGNIHLVARWLGTLDKKLERYSVGSHEDYRVLISAEPAPSPESHIIPQGILENAIKITNEPPTGMHANLHKALDLFTQDTLEMCTKEIEFKCILFALCYFHAVVAERRKFGAQGWNRSYPFNNGDLTISVNVLYNYLEANTKVPWDDLRYLFGEIMYGGHITDDWDRRLCRTYLGEYIRAEMLEGEVLLAPGFQIPPNLDYKGYHEYIDENLPPESPYLYGLHPNAEIGFLTVTSEKLFRTVLEMQPKETDSGAGTGVSREEKVGAWLPGRRQEGQGPGLGSQALGPLGTCDAGCLGSGFQVKAVLDEILEKLPDAFNMAEIMAKAAEKTPYVVVAAQECERMNLLTHEVRRSLKELNLGLKGELTITPDMEDLATALFYDTVPDTWVARAYPSMMGLAAWYADLLLRIRELEAWTTDFVLPTAVWLAGFFNPQSFLTAIMQSMARKNEWPLDKMCLAVEVTKKNREDMTAPPREGAYVYGLFMEGARWDTQTGAIAEARLKELTPAVPVVFIKAVPADRVETKNVYECPVYKTRVRGPTYVWTFNLKTKEKAAKWILAAVALLLQV
uniref:Dynein axonemal heavy chain 17 n=1 Tax=Sus scrofa TaxID=9823 RepID=A0A4X1UP38_PIG